MNRETRPSDSELLDRYRSGDEEAFAELFRRHEEGLRAAAERRVRGDLQRRISVSDLIQETRLVAFTRREAFEPGADHGFRRWLHGILKMKVREAERHHRLTDKRSLAREVPRGLRPDTRLFRSREPSPSQVTVAAELAALARRAVADLPEDYRRILELTRGRRLSVEEAAAEMGRTPEATRKLCGRALCRFREVFEALRRDGAS